LSFDPVDGLTVDVRTSNTGSIACDPADSPNGGVFVQVDGLSADATGALASAPCGQSLSRLTNGDLFAYPEGARQVTPANVGPTSDDGVQDVGGSSGYNAHTDINTTLDRQFTVTNPFDCTAWCFFTMGEMKILGSRLPDAGGPGGVNHTGPETFYVTAEGNIAVAGDVINSPNRVDIHGSWSGSPGSGASTDHQWAWNMHALFPIAALDTVTVTASITTIKKYHFYMVDDAFGDGGVAMLHPAAVVWREEPLR
jgi:hypothetical protein